MKKNNGDNNIKVLSLFSGIGAFEKALSNLNINYELIGYCENDKYASKAYSAVHKIDENFNLGDVRDINETILPGFNLMTYGFPCQDISIAGRLKGISEETRSGLVFEALRILKYNKPKYAIAENVKNLVSKRFKNDFLNLLDILNSYGYNNYWCVLNAKSFNIPQNRERVFIVSIRKDIDKGYAFPEPTQLTKKVRDFLDNEVERKYYWSESMLKLLLRRKEQGYSKFVQDSYAKCFTASKSYLETNLIRIKDGTKKGYKEFIPTSETVLNLSFPNSQTKRGRVKNGYTPTLDTSCNVGVFENNEIRKLTPLECWRLMGFEDSDYWAARHALEQAFYNGKDRSDSQMYKMAGNSIVVNVIEAIFKSLLVDSHQNNNKFEAA